MVRMIVNGLERDVDATAGRTLLDALREDLGLTGTKYGCGEGECGACTVLVGDQPVRACIQEVVALDHATITTIEGLASGPRLHAVQEAFVGCRALQCGYCTPGMVMSTVALLRANPAPAEAQVRTALAGNICRCGGYPMILRAVLAASVATENAPPEPGQPHAAGSGQPSAPAGAVWTAHLRFDHAHPGTQRDWGWSTPGGAKVTIDDQGAIVAYSGKVDGGQGNRAALRRLVAAELCTTTSAVRMELGDTDLVPFDLGTFGSRSTPDSGRALRVAAAALKDELMRSAASIWQLTVDQVSAADGAVHERGGWRTIRYGALVAAGPRTVEVDPDRALAPAPAGLAALDDGDARDLLVAATTGAKRFPSDVAVPEMWHGVVLRPPSHGAVLESVDSSAADWLSNVAVVRDGDLVAVAAPTARRARVALDLLRPVWHTTPQPGQADLEQHLRIHGVGDDRDLQGEATRDIGDVEKAAADADYHLAATYTTAYVAHVPMEPRVAVASVGDARVTVWVGTQRPFGVRDSVAAALGLDPASVRVVVPDFGGGFGGKHSADVAVEAARLARAIGRPVRVAWTRQEEFAWAYFRPAAVIDVRASATRDGTLTGWEFTNVNSGAAALASPYATANIRERFQRAESPLPQGSYRALAATANNFARESHIDEIATLLGIDPVEFRMRHLDDPRLAHTLTTLATHVDWSNRATRDGHGLGIACGVEKGARVATAAEVEVGPDGTIRVTRVVTAVDCGAVVDPAGLRNQVIGATVMGLGGALFEAVRFDGGRIRNASLAGYRVPRFTDVPEIEVVILDQSDLASSGAGETPIIAVAPAIANGIAAAAGRRLRALPLIPDGRLPRNDDTPR